MVETIYSFLSGNSNCYVVLTRNQNYLIDAGSALDKHFIEKLSRIISPEKIDMLLLTHGHCDHVGNAWLLQNNYGVRVGMHKNDVDKVTTGYELPSQKRRIINDILRSHTLKEMRKTILFHPDILFDQDFVKLPGIDVVHLPGHTAGSVGYIFHNNIFIGDLFFNLITPIPAFLAEDKQILKQSIQKLKSMRHVWYCYVGHGHPFPLKQ